MNFTASKMLHSCSMSGSILSVGTHSPPAFLRFPLKRSSCLNTKDPSSDYPTILTASEVCHRLTKYRESFKPTEEYLAMYSSIVGGITTDPAAMVLPIDDHMVHRGHAVFDTAAIIGGYLYELDQHIDRIIRSASLAKITLPFDRETIRNILIQTVKTSKCVEGSLRYWLSVGPGDFRLSPKNCIAPSFYAIVVQNRAPFVSNGVRVITSSVPIKPPEFATVKSVNYLPNALSAMEAEENGAFAAIWLDEEGFVAEGQNMNVAFVTNEMELVMPRFEKVLSGCTAKRVLKLAEEMVKEGRIRGIRVKDVKVDEGKSSREMMLVGSGILVLPILQWDDKVIGNGKEGPIAQALLEMIVQDMKSGSSSVRIQVN